MRVFLRVAENNSFSRAAVSLDLSNAAVTRYIALLEAHLNTRLLNRTTRSLSLTEAGQAYLRGCRQMLDLMETIDSSVGRGTSEPNGTLKLVAASSFSHVELSPLVKRYCERYPKVRLDLQLLHRSVDLVESGFDVGILAARQVSASTLVMRPLASLRSVAVASPAWVERHGEPVTPAQLSACGMLAPSRDVHAGEWCFVDAHGEEQVVSVPALCTVNDLVMLRELARVQMGVAILPAAYVKDDLESGALVQVLGGYEIRGGVKELALVYPGRRHMSPKARAFIDLAIEHFQSECELGGMTAVAQAA